MQESTDRSRMRGVAMQLDGAEIEFEDGVGAVVRRKRIVLEHLPKSRAGGLHAVRRKVTQNVSARKRE